DLLGDAKWTDYLDFCDRFYWGLAPALDLACLEQDGFLPDRCGVIVADGYDAEIVRPAPLLQMAAARRKVEVVRLARAALRRMITAADPHTLQ
ncbi:MAG: MmcB family DNA repair protein, partial [Alphaproteobacteria bacterium]|nr:MmcB family DNA repair protein [Alphaproteobacteria bacterium]